jgi:hypothetical protein
MPSFQARNTGAGSLSSGSAKPSMSAACFNRSCRLKVMPACQAGSTGNASALTPAAARALTSSGLRLRNGRAGGLARRADFALRLRGLRVMPKETSKFGRGARRLSPYSLKYCRMRRRKRQDRDGCQRFARQGRRIGDRVRVQVRGFRPYFPAALFDYPWPCSCTLCRVAHGESFATEM